MGIFDSASKPGGDLWTSAPPARDFDPQYPYDDPPYPAIPLPPDGGSKLIPYLPRPPFDPGPPDPTPGPAWNPAPGGAGQSPNKWWDPQTPDIDPVDPTFLPKPDPATVPPGFKPKPPVPPAPPLGWQDPDYPAPAPAPSLVPPLQMPGPPKWQDPPSMVPKLQLDPNALVPPGRDDNS